MFIFWNIDFKKLQQFLIKRPKHLLSICFRANVVHDVRYAHLQLVADRSNPRIELHSEYSFVTHQIQVPCNMNYAVYVPSSYSTTVHRRNIYLPISGGNTVKRFPWICNSLRRVSSPISFGNSIRSFSLSTSWNVTIEREVQDFS